MPRDFLSILGHAVFLVENAETLCCASALLSGKKAEPRTRRLINEVGMAAPMTQRLRRNSTRSKICSRFVMSTISTER